MSRPANFAAEWGDIVGGPTAVAITSLVAAVTLVKPGAVCATTAAITLATGLEAGDVIDGIVLGEGDRVLVKDQADARENGIYVVAASGAPSRALDADTGSEIYGCLVVVLSGVTNGGQLYRNTNGSIPTIGTDNITFALFVAPASPDVPYDHGLMGATETLNLANGTWHRGTLNADCTITVTGWTVDEGVVAIFKVAQDATGGYGITWDPDVVFVGEDQPGDDPNAVTWYLLWSDEGDATIYGAIVGGGAAATTTTSSGIGPLLLASDHAAPIVFDDILQASDGADLLYASEP